MRQIDCGNDGNMKQASSIVSNSNAERFCRSVGIDRWPRVSIRVGGHSVAAYQVCGVVGLLMAMLTTATIVSLRALPMRVLAWLTVSGVVTFLGLAMATKIVLGREELVYYRHEVAILCTTLGLLVVLGEPPVAFLEATLLGLGAFLACGRVGCFLVGCCHGRPHHFGVRYCSKHVDEGFPAAWVGVRLFPVQLVESVVVVAIVAYGVHLVQRGALPGHALAWYSMVYGTLRFVLEFVRGDRARCHFGSFSEAQWTTILLMSLTLVAEVAGILPLCTWHTWVTLSIVSFMVAWSVTDSTRRRLFRPAHLEELAALMKVATARSRERGELQMGVTRLGLRLSSCSIPHPTGGTWTDTVAFSASHQTLGPRAARRLARLLSLVDGRQAELIASNSGIYHLVFPCNGAEHAL